MSNVEAEGSRSLPLKGRSWFDVPLVYVTQRRAIIAIEKDAPRRTRVQRRIRGVGKQGARH